MSNRYYIYDSYTDSVAEFGKGGLFRNMQAVAKKTQRKVGRTAAGRAVGNAAKTVGAQASLRGQQALGLATSAPGLAAIGTAGAVGGGYALKKRSDRKAQERSSIKGRIKRLLGR